MKKMVFYAIGILLPVCKGFGQTIKPIGIDDTVPQDIVFRDIIHYKTTTAKLSDFKGKLVILDFWATWCGPCVKGMPGLDSLQEKYKDQLQVLPVTTEKKPLVLAFLERRKNIHLPSVVEDSLLLRYFPRRIIPHSVLLNKEGKVIAITNPAFISDSIIERAAAGYAIQLPVKEDNVNFNKSRPLFVDNTDQLADRLLYRSMITRHVDGVNSGISRTKIDSLRIGLSCRNITLPHLFLIGLDKPAYYMKSRLCLENVKDSGRYLINGSNDPQVYTNWLTNNTFCYDLVCPATVPDRVKYHLMQQSLAEYFSILYGLSCSIEERELPCYDLKKTGNSSLLISSGTMPVIAYVAKDDKMIYKDVTTADFVTQLEQQLGIPVYDDSGIRQQISVTIDQPIIEAAIKNCRPEEMNRSLKAYGLTLVPSKRRLEAIVLRESGN